MQTRIRPKILGGLQPPQHPPSYAYVFICLYVYVYCIFPLHVHCHVYMFFTCLVSIYPLPVLVALCIIIFHLYTRTRVRTYARTCIHLTITSASPARASCCAVYRAYVISDVISVAQVANVKKPICTCSILQSPDFNKEFILQTDAYRGVGAGQKDESDTDRPVAYYSKRLLRREEHY